MAPGTCQAWRSGARRAAAFRGTIPRDARPTAARPRLSRLLSQGARLALSGVVFMLVMATLRLRPVFAQPFSDAPALPLFGAAALLAVVAGLLGQDRRPVRLAPFALAWAASLAALSIVVALRPSQGLTLRIDSPEATTWLPNRGLEIAGRDLRDFADPRKALLSWTGRIEAPSSGRYVMTARGRGRLVVRLDGRELLATEGDSLQASQAVGLTKGPHDLEVELRAHGPGLRLRLGWTRPGTFGPWEDDVVPPRYLGEGRSRGWWPLTDLLALLFAAATAALVWVVPWNRPKPLPAPAPTTAGELGASALAYAVVLAVMSWPLVTDPARLGVTDRPDGRLNAWILAWDVHALTRTPGRLFDAPIFHPLPDALAFSENLVLPAVLSAPALWAGGPVLAYNFVLFLSLVVSGLGVQLLVRRASGDGLAAFVAGAVFAAGAHRWIRLAHLHAQVTLFLPFALLALDRFWERRTLQRALFVGLLLALQGLSSVYLGAITAAALAAAVGIAIVAGLRWGDLAKLALGGVLAASLLLPVTLPYLRMRSFQGVEFTASTVAEYATTLDSYAASGTRLYGGWTSRHIEPERVRDTLFPGLLALLLGLCGLARAPRRYAAVIVAASVLAVVVSLGPATGFYRFLHEHFVLVRGVRALSRFSLIPVLGLSVLAGFALAGRRWFVSLAALVLLMAESSNAPIEYGRYEPPSAAARWLAGREGAVAYLPLGERDTDAMLEGIAHFRPLVNGDSGFLPRPYDRAMELLNESPGSDEAQRFLRATGVSHVVMRSPAVGYPAVADLEGDTVGEVPKGPAAVVVEGGRPVPSLFEANGGTLVDLGVPTVVDRVSFEPDARPWVARPSVSTSLDGHAWEPAAAFASLADATLSLMRDPRHGRAEVRFAAREVRFVRLDARLPASPAAFRVGGDGPPATTPAK